MKERRMKAVKERKAERKDIQKLKKGKIIQKGEKKERKLEKKDEIKEGGRKKRKKLKRRKERTLARFHFPPKK